MFVVLVTGSRDWADQDRVIRELDDLWVDTEGPLFVRHGGCPTGADRAASIFCGFDSEDVYEVEHLADWKTHGKAAGPIRNQEMVDLGADICLAFPLGKSVGTWDCVRRANKAGIPVKVVEG